MLKTEDFIIQGYASGAPVSLLASKFRKTEPEILQILRGHFNPPKRTKAKPSNEGIEP